MTMDGGIDGTVHVGIWDLAGTTGEEISGTSLMDGAADGMIHSGTLFGVLTGDGTLVGVGMPDGDGTRGPGMAGAVVSGAMPGAHLTGEVPLIDPSMW